MSESSERFLYKIHITLSISANCYVFEWLVRHLFDICRFLSRKYSLVKSDTAHKCHLLSPPVSESFVEDSRVISVTCSFTWQCKEILANFFRSPLTATLPDMARVYNWDVKRRSKDNLLKSAERP